jgi:hypothetical protein
MPEHHRCECPKSGRDPRHAPNECPTPATLHIVRDGRVLWVCWSCTFAGDKQANPSL